MGWSFSQRESLRDAWSLFEHARCTGISFSPRCFEALLMECKQRIFFEHEIAFLKGLQNAAGNHCAEVGFGPAVKRVGAMRLTEINEMTLSDSQLDTGTNHKAGDAASVCILCGCCGQRPAPP